MSKQRITKLFISAEEIEEALKRLRGPVDRDEAIVMAAAQAAADALRGNKIVGQDWDPTEKSIT